MESVHSRHQLINALSQAGELEHLLCCSYLYAGFSLKRTPDDTLDAAETETTRKWQASIMHIARQEMEHLGLVCNLLGSIGAGANFSRPNYPQSRNYLPIDLPFELRRFEQDALDSFIQFEQPHWNQVDTNKDEDWPVPYSNLQELYEYIRAAFQALDRELGADKLFVGPTDAQITNENLFQETTQNYSVNLTGVTAKDPADRLPQAIAIIDQIITEGEGTVSSTGASHYARFCAIREEFDAIKNERGDAFQPAYPLALNPRTFIHAADKDGTPITNNLAREVAGLFNLVYETMLMLMIRLYAQTNEDATKTTAIQEIAFFPLMTMGIRPLAEVLVDLPVDDGESGERAGPTFELARHFKFLPHENAAWIVLQEYLDELGSEARRIADAARIANSSVAERLDFIAKSLVRNARNFGAFIQGKEDF